MKKKLLSLLLVGALSISMLAGCGNQGNSADNSNATEESGDTADNNDTNAENDANTGGEEAEPEGGDTGDAGDENASDGSYSNKQVIIGDPTETSGDVTPYWTNNASDYYVFQMITGLDTVSVNQDGKWVVNETVVDSLEEQENDDGTKTYTIKIKDGLKFSNGEAVTAKDYVFSYLFWGSNEMLVDLEAAEASASNPRYVLGYAAYSAGESDTFEGVHLIDDMTFSITIDKQFLPYYYGKALVSITPEYMPGWVPEDVTIEETENGAKFSDNFTSEYISDNVNEFRYNPTVCTGAYMFTSYDKNAYSYTLTKNPEFPGNFEGQTANIETVIYKYVAQDTMMDQLKTGAIDILLQCADGNDIGAGLDLVDEGGYDYINYPRAGYGMVCFKCNQGPTQFVEVRQAMAHLLDRNAFAQTFTGGHGVVVNGPYGSSQWMVNEHADEVDALNAYNYSPETAVELLEKGGWTLNEDGSEYSGSGIRYKKLEDGTMMPLIIEWCSSEDNSVSDLLVTSLQKNPDVEASGMQINQTVVTFNELMEHYYDPSEENPYQMFNLATGFGNPYDVAYMFEPGADSNINCLLDPEGTELYDLAVAMNQTEEDNDEAYGENWVKFMQKWNELVPELPLYSNDYHDFFSTKVHDYDEDGYNWNIAQAILYANVE